MRIYLVTLFPEAMRTALLRGVLKKGHDANRFSIECIDLRHYGVGPRNKIDDAPFGKQSGMVIRADVIQRAVMAIPNYSEYPIILMTPSGTQLDQGMAKAWSSQPGLIVISAYYEGVDYRIFNILPIIPVSIGPYVVSSGDLPALIVAESTVRLLPGVVGCMDNVIDDSYVSELLESPSYTQPRDLGPNTDLSVPEVLLSGHHQRIADWKRCQSLSATFFKQPRLLSTLQTSQADQAMLLSILKGEN
ncbi:MAG: hypothetical protein P8L47_01680 [Candidatus Marinamargulisbacteria bacterium]|nr:hypothetical protein [bacterium]MDG2264814.1 hypothetical protein [Candidatus Marinamargulisbacteria bacterium]|tara:strand:- start:934 stop:1674 length:741 start_codon:yes stop_codon:yes gene_type:complete